MYLRPLGVIGGADARSALCAGWAQPMLGGEAAFAGCEIWRRGADGPGRETLPVIELERWLATRGETVRTRVACLLERLAAPPVWPAGLPLRRPLLMGVVNVTPDSFSDGGRFLDPAAAIAHGRRLHLEGADVVDLGGESTRPGAGVVAVEEEIRRVVPVVEALAREGILVSIDSRRAAVMRAAVAAGARMINDVSALRHDPESLAVAGASGLPVVLMHSQGEPATMQAAPRYDDALLDVFDHLEERIDAWTEAGFDRARLLIDPGIGFGKTLDHNLEVLSRIGVYLTLGAPLLLGVSRKRFIGTIAGEVSPAERLPGSLAAAIWAMTQGVAMIRVHDVAATRQALAVWQAVETGVMIPGASGVVVHSDTT